MNQLRFKSLVINLTVGTNLNTPLEALFLGAMNKPAAILFKPLARNKRWPKHICRFKSAFIHQGDFLSHLCRMFAHQHHINDCTGPVCVKSTGRQAVSAKKFSFP
ncbi:Uncharacterised protein [Salmonella enterica subsp. enterica serovar Typhi]|nr:Uncharacterised protein [Salmonella enterica subsp. enterica serovar Typhi]